MTKFRLLNFFRPGNPATDVAVCRRKKNRKYKRETTNVHVQCFDESKSNILQKANSKSEGNLNFSLIPFFKRKNTRGTRGQKLSSKTQVRKLKFELQSNLTIPHTDGSFGPDVI